MLILQFFPSYFNIDYCVIKSPFSHAPFTLLPSPFHQVCSQANTKKIYSLPPCFILPPSIIGLQV